VSFLILILGVLALGVTGWLVGRAKARSLNTGRRVLHSLPSYHGWHLALWILIPALLGLAIWSWIAPGLIHSAVLTAPEAAHLPVMDMERDALLAEAYQMASNPGAEAFNPGAEKLVPAIQAATAKFNWIGAAFVALLAFCGGGFGYTRVKSAFPARTRVEQMAHGGADHSRHYRVAAVRSRAVFCPDIAD
jgi:phosphate transport system permease protein